MSIGLRSKLLICTAVANIAFACAQTTRSQELMPFFEGEVIAVTDGDSLTVKLDTGKKFQVRLQGIGAPELRQPHGAESRKNLADKILGKQVKVEFRFTDDLGRVLGKIVNQGEDVGLAQLQSGLAWFYTKFANELTNDDREIYDEAFVEATKAKVGLWKDKAPISPWAYRAQNKIEEGNEPVAVLTGQIIGNSRTKIFLKPNCPGYKAVPAKYKVLFETESDAQRAGYRSLKNCR